MQTLKGELFYAIAKFLQDESCIDAAQLVRKFIDEKNILPKRINTHGKLFDHDFRSFDNIYCQKDSRLLYKYFKVLVDLLKKSEWNVEDSNSLLGITSKIDRCYFKRTFSIESLSGIRHDISHPFEDLYNRIHCQMDLVSHNLAHRNAIYCLQFDRRGEFAFTGSDDYTIKIWSLQTKSDNMPCTIRHVLRGHAGEIIEISISADNHLLASVDARSCLIIWCLRTGQPILSMRGSPLNRVLSGLSFVPVHVPQQPAQKVQGPDEDEDRLSHECTSSDSATVATPNGWLAVTSFGGFLHLIPYQHHVRSAADSAPNTHRWSCCSITVLPTVRFTTAPTDTPTAFWPSIACMDVSPGGAFIATGCSDQRVRLYQLTNPTRPELAAVLDAHEECVNHVAFSHFGLKMATGSSDGGSCWLWRLQAGTWRSMPLTSRKRIKCRPCLLIWSKHDRYLIAAMKNGSVYVYFGDSGRLATVIEGHEGAVYSVTPSPFDDNIMATAGVDGRFQIWNVERHRNHTAQLNSNCSSLEPNPFESGCQQNACPLLYHYRYPPGQFRSTEGFVWLPSDPVVHDQPIWSGTRRSIRDTPLGGAVPPQRDRSTIAQDPGTEAHVASEPLHPCSRWNQRITACRALPIADGVGFLVVTKSGLMSLFRPTVHESRDENQPNDSELGHSSLSNPADKSNIREQFFHWELDTAEWRQSPLDRRDILAVQRFQEISSLLGTQIDVQAPHAYDLVRDGQRNSRLSSRQVNLYNRNNNAEEDSTGSSTATIGPLLTSNGTGYEPPAAVLFEMVHSPSGVPFHRLPPPYLTNFIGVPLPPESQLYVPGRSSLDNPLYLIPSLTIDEDGIDIVIDDIQFRTEDVPSDYCPPVHASSMRPIAGKTYLWQSVWLDGCVSLIEPLSLAELAIQLEQSRNLYEEEIQYYLSQGDAVVTLTDEPAASEKPYLSIQPARNAFGPPDMKCSSLEIGSIWGDHGVVGAGAVSSPLPAANTIESVLEPPGPSFLHKFLANRFESQNGQNHKNDNSINSNNTTNHSVSSNGNGSDNHHVNNHNSQVVLTSTGDASHIVPVDNFEPSQVVNDLDYGEDEDPDDDASEESEWSEHVDVDIGWWHRQRRRNRLRRAAAAAAQNAPEPLSVSEEPSDTVNHQQSQHQVRRIRSSGSGVRRVRHLSTSHMRQHTSRRRSGAVLHPCRRSIRQQRRLMLRHRMLREMRLAEVRTARENRRQSQRRHGRMRRISRSSLPTDKSPQDQVPETAANSKPLAQTEEDTISARRERLKRRLIRSMDYALFTSSFVPLSSIPPEGYLGPDCEGSVYPMLTNHQSTVHWPGPHFDWLSSLHPTATPYVPQLGDRLVYIVRGHKEYMSQVWQNCELPALTHAGSSSDAAERASSLPWVAFPEIPPYTCGVVTEIHYDTVRTITDNSTIRIPTGTYRGSRATAAWRRRGSRSGVKHARTSSKRLPTSVPDSVRAQNTSSSTVPVVTYSGDSFVRLVTLRIQLDPNDQPYSHLARSTTSLDNSTLCETRLCSKFTATQIDVTYHDVDGVLDFLILRHLFDAAIRRSWKSGDLFICPVGEVWWTGCVLNAPTNFITNQRLSCEPSTSSTPMTRGTKDPWLTCLIRWLEDDQLSTAINTRTMAVELPQLSGGPLTCSVIDKEADKMSDSLPENVDRLSPWDMHLLCATPLPDDVGRVYPSQEQIRRNYGADIQNSTPLRASEKNRVRTKSGESSIDWSLHARSLLECFREIMKLPVSEMFNQPVDLASYPDYLFVNPYPVDLTLIVARLTTGFYRQLAAVRSDLQHLLDNAVRYNRPDSTVVQHAHMVYKLAVRALDDPRFESCRIPQEYEQLLAAESKSKQPQPSTSVNRKPQSVSPRSEAEHAGSSRTVETTGANLSSTETHVYNSAPSRRVRHTPRNLVRSSRTINSETKSSPNDEVNVTMQDADHADPCHCSLVPGKWVPRCIALIKRLCMHNRSMFFREPIDTNVYPDYLDIVSMPMDLSTVQKRLRNTLDPVRARPGLRRRRTFIYACPHAFLRDMHRIVRNSKQYNDDPETVVHDDTCWLENWIERELITTLRRFRLLPSNPGQGSSAESQSVRTVSRLYSTRGSTNRPTRFSLRSRLASSRSRRVRRLCSRPSHRSAFRGGRPRIKHTSAGSTTSNQSSRFNPEQICPRRTSSGRVVRPPLRNSDTIHYTSSISSQSDDDSQDQVVKRGRKLGRPNRTRTTPVTPENMITPDVGMRRSKRRRQHNARRWSPFIVTDEAISGESNCD